MDIKDHAQMMRYLTRPRDVIPDPSSMDQASLTEELEPGALKDEMLKDFDPSQETYEEYLRRKRLGERPFNMAEGGQLVAPSVDGSRPGYNGKDKYFTDRVTDKKRLKALDKAAQKYGYKNWKSVPITTGSGRGDRERVGAHATRRQKGIVTISETRKGKIPGNVKSGDLYKPKIIQKRIDTSKLDYQTNDPVGKRLQWIADNGKNFDRPEGS